MSLIELNVDQLISVKVHLEPNEMVSNYETIIEQKIKNTYGNKCYINGYIYRESIKLVKIGAARRTGAHLTGAFTIPVVFSSTFCIPKKDDVVDCRVKLITKFAVIAQQFPIDNIIIPRSIQIEKDASMIEEGKITIGQYIQVRVISSKIINNDGDKQLSVGGYIVSTRIEAPTKQILPVSKIGFDPSDIVVACSNSKPKISGIVDTNVNMLTIENDIPGREKWNQIRGLINPYEFLDTNYKEISFDVVNDDGSKSLLPCPYIISRAYYKIWEIIKSCEIDKLLAPNPEMPSISITCLAEAPGGFINAIKNIRNNPLDIISTISINDKNIQYNKNIVSNVKLCQYGDLTNPDDINDFIAKVGANSQILITADGGIDKGSAEGMYDFVEPANAKLFYGEIITALKLQSRGGTFIIKMYDIYYDITLQLIVILQNYYDKVEIIKPKTSRPANSEKYLVCYQFKGIDDNVFDKLLEALKVWNTIETVTLDVWNTNAKYVHNLFRCDFIENSQFIEEMRIFNQRVANAKMSKIAEGLTLYRSDEYKKIKSAREAEQLKLAREWCLNYGVSLKQILN